MDGDETEFLTVKDVCARAGVSTDTLYRHIKAGHLSPTKVSTGGAPRNMFKPDDMSAYVRKLPTLTKGAPAIEMLKAVKAEGFVNMAALCALAAISDKTVRKHMEAGLVRGERRQFHGRTIWVFEQDEADRYAKIARDLISERTTGIYERGKVRPPAGYITTRELAQRSRRGVVYVQNRIRSGELKATRFERALIVSEPDAERFVEEFGLSAPPKGMITVNEAAKMAGVVITTIMQAIRQGYLTAIPVKNVATSEGRTTGRSRILVSAADVKWYAHSTPADRRRKRGAIEMAQLGQQLSGKGQK